MVAKPALVKRWNGNYPSLWLNSHPHYVCMYLSSIFIFMRLSSCSPAEAGGASDPLCGEMHNCCYFFFSASIRFLVIFIFVIIIPSYKSYFYLMFLVKKDWQETQVLCALCHRHHKDSNPTTHVCEFVKSTICFRVYWFDWWAQTDVLILFKNRLSAQIWVSNICIF